MCIESEAQKARASVVGSISELLQGRVAHREFKYKHSNSNAKLALCQCDKHKPSQRRLVGCDSPTWSDGGFFACPRESQDLNAEICSSPTVGSKPLTLMGLASRTLDPAHQSSNIRSVIQIFTQHIHASSLSCCITVCQCHVVVVSP